MAIMQILLTSVTIVVPLITTQPSVPSLVMTHDAKRLEKNELKSRRTWREVVVVAVAVVEDVVVVAVAVMVEIETLGMMTMPRKALTLAS